MAKKNVGVRGGIEMVPVGEVRPYEGNPHTIGEDAVDAVASSIRQFGFRVPIVVDKDGVIINGHTRLRAALKLGLETVPVIRAVDLTPEQVRAYRIADNKVAEFSEWDDEKLRIELEGLQGGGVAIDELGFAPDKIAELLAPAGTDGLVDQDDVPEPPAETVTKLGDLWILGHHRLRCGDSTNPADVDALMAGEHAALCATDPPYLVDYTGERPNGTGKDWTANYREVDIVDADKFFRGVFENVLRVIAPHAAVYTWHAHKRQALIAKVWAELGILDHQQIVWVKPTPVFGRVFWHFQHEPCMMGWKQGSIPAHDSNHEISSVWEVDYSGKSSLAAGLDAGDGGTSVWRIDWEGKSRVVGNEHPTQKPVEIFARPMRKHTKPGAVVYEPFSGSGSQMIAAEQLGRRCFGMEISPVFVEVAVRRWEQFTGRKAERVPAAGG